MIYSILHFLYYNVSWTTLPLLAESSLGPGGYLLGLILCSAFILSFFALYYTFRSIGLYKMAKRSGVVKPFLALIPFFGIYVCYRLSPNSKYVKKQTANCVLAIIFGATVLLVNCLIDIFYAVPAIVDLVKLNKAMVEVNSQAVVPASIFNFDSTLLALLSGYLSIVNVVYAVFMLLVYSRLFMSYTVKPTKLVLFSALGYYFLGTFLLAGIFVFALRNKPRIDYDSYIEAKRQWQEKMRYGGYYGGNPYGGNQYGGPFGSNPNYGNPNNGNNQGYGPYYGNQQNPNGYNYGRQTDVDPFEEFNSSSNSNNNQDDSDDFFN